MFRGLASERPSLASGFRYAHVPGARTAWQIGAMNNDESPPDEAALYAAAMRHVARYAATEARLLEVLENWIRRWLERRQDPDPADTAAARAAARRVVARLVATGAVNDAAFAHGRAARLARSGRSRSQSVAHLRSRGVATELSRRAVQESAGDELHAALLFARRRRLGPFRVNESSLRTSHMARTLARFVRAGFPLSVARAVLALSHDAACAMLNGGPDTSGGG